jgi:drug/metabolite transporter (DMT)-like permease
MPLPRSAVETADLLPSDRKQAIAAMIFAAFVFAILGAAAKAVARPVAGLPSLPGSEIALFRFACGLIFLLTVAKVREINLLGNDRKGLLMRGLSGGIASTAFFIGIKHTTLTNATLLNYTFVIWGPILAALTLGEHLKPRAIFALLMAMAGVAMITRPEFGHIRFGDAVALFSGLVAGIAVAQIRRLRQGESAFAIFFYFNLFGIPIALLSLPLDGTPFVLPALPQVPYLLIIGACSVTAQLLMTYGYRALTAAQGSLLTLTSVVYSAFASYFLFHEAFTALTLWGSLLILGAACLMVAGIAVQGKGE